MEQYIKKGLTQTQGMIDVNKYQNEGEVIKMAFLSDENSKRIYSGLAEYTREFRRLRREAGLCLSCVNPAEPNRVHCSKHLAMNCGRQIKRNTEWKRLGLAAYGAVCVCCGETEERLLTVDHVNDDGGKHRKEINARTNSWKQWKWAADNNYPPNLQVLCFNCNFGKALYGRCPHKKD